MFVQPPSHVGFDGRGFDGLPDEILPLDDLRDLLLARKARDADSDAQLIHIEATGPIAPIQPRDHPDLVLARAVAAAVLDADEANLIAAIRLDNATVAQVADKLGIAASTASA